MVIIYFFSSRLAPCVYLSADVPNFCRRQDSDPGPALENARGWGERFICLPACPGDPRVCYNSNVPFLKLHSEV